MEQTLGNRITANRKRLGLTQEQLADQLGVTPQAVSKWENNQSYPDITTLPKLASIFGVSTDELMGVKQETVHQAEIVTDHTTNESKDQWVFNWDNSRKDSLGIAVWVLMTGVLLFLNNLLRWNAGLWSILWTGGLMIFGLFGLFPKFSFFRLGCALFGGGFLIRELGILKLPIGKDMILPLLLLLFGLSLLADAFKKPKNGSFRFVQNGHSNKKEKSTFEMLDDHFQCSVSFGERSHVITLPCLDHGEASVCFGELKVDLTGCQQINPGATIAVSCSFGALELQVPRSCIVSPRVDNHFGEINIHGSPDPDATAPLYVSGSTSFGEFTVRYV